MTTTLPTSATAVVRTGDRQPRVRRTRAKRPRLAATVLILGALYCLIPVAWVVIASSKSPSELFTSFSFAPGTGLLDNFANLSSYGGGQFWLWSLNSLLYAGVGAVLSTLISAMAGYALSKFRFRGREALFSVVLAGVLVPGIVLAVPQYLLMAAIGLAGTHWSVLLPVLINPFGIFLCRVFATAAVPEDTLEAARLDGAGEVRIFGLIALPMMAQGLVTVFLLQFVGIWNNFLLPFIMLSDQDKYPLTLGLYTFLSKGAGDTSLLPAGDHRLRCLRDPADRPRARPAALLASRPARRRAQRLSPTAQLRPCSRRVSPPHGGPAHDHRSTPLPRHLDRRQDAAMKFTDGYWEILPGVTALYAQETHDVWEQGGGLVAYAPTKRIESRGDTLNRPLVTVSLTSPAEGVIRVRIEHHRGTRGRGGFSLPGDQGQRVGEATVLDGIGTLTSGPLTATVREGAPWSLEFTSGGTRLTGSGHRSVGYMRDAAGRAFVHEQLDLGVGEHIYGLGERFGPLVKNGQTVDIWNADGGTSSEQSYKNIPFYLSDRGYGVLVDDPGAVSFEVGTETVERVQFSVEGEVLEYLVIAGPTGKDVLERYTALAGRPAIVPAWSYGLWLTTSFTTVYDEDTVNSFIDGFAERDLPLSAFHFDCFWMREFNWTDFVWDPRAFPDPDGMLQRLHDRDLRVCVWINPYIAQSSRLFDEAAAAGYLVRKPDGDVWQWDMWQAGMALVDFTDPDAVTW